MEAGHALFFTASSSVIAAVGIAIILPTLRSGDFNRLFVSLLAAFVLKLLLGVAVFVVAWKVIGWESTTSVIGAIAAYFAALMVTTVVTIASLKRGRT